MKRIGIVLLMLLLMAVTALAEPVGITNIEKLNVRESPGGKTKILTKVWKAGTEVFILEKLNDEKGTLWYRVRLQNGKEGYVLGRYVDFDPKELDPVVFNTLDEYRSAVMNTVMHGSTVFGGRFNITIAGALYTLGGTRGVDYYIPVSFSAGTYKANQPVSFTVSLKGGTPPYRVFLTVSSGDGSEPAPVAVYDAVVSGNEVDWKYLPDPGYRQLTFEASITDALGMTNNPDTAGLTVRAEGTAGAAASPGTDGLYLSETGMMVYGNEYQRYSLPLSLSFGSSTYRAAETIIGTVQIGGGVPPYQVEIIARETGTGAVFSGIGSTVSMVTYNKNLTWCFTPQAATAPLQITLSVRDGNGVTLDAAQSSTVLMPGGSGNAAAGIASGTTATGQMGTAQKYPNTAVPTKYNVNIRKEPSSGSAIAFKIQNRIQVTVLGETTDASGETWYLIRKNDGSSGYIRGDLLEIGAVSNNVEPKVSKTAKPASDSTGSPGANPTPSATDSGSGKKTEAEQNVEYWNNLWLNGT